jgi:hypothetical protein
MPFWDERIYWTNRLQTATNAVDAARAAGDGPGLAAAITARDNAERDLRSFLKPYGLVPAPGKAL